MTVRRARREVSALEFLDWQSFLTAEDEDKFKEKWGKDTRPENHYLAQISLWLYVLNMRVDGMFSKTRMSPKSMGDFLIDFQIDRILGKEPDHPALEQLNLDEEERLELRKRQSKRSEAVWGAWIGAVENLQKG
jgi:hypothetical protein